MSKTMFNIMDTLSKTKMLVDALSTRQPAVRNVMFVESSGSLTAPELAHNDVSQ